LDVNYIVRLNELGLHHCTLNYIANCDVIDLYKIITGKLNDILNRKIAMNELIVWSMFFAILSDVIPLLNYG